MRSLDLELRLVIGTVAKRAAAGRAKQVSQLQSRAATLGTTPYPTTTYSRVVMEGGRMRAQITHHLPLVIVWHTASRLSTFKGGANQLGAASVTN